MHSKYDASHVSKSSGSSTTATATTTTTAIAPTTITSPAIATLPKADTVIGFGADYNLKTYQHFIGSLRNTGFTGNIIIGMGSWDDYNYNYSGNGNGNGNGNDKQKFSYTHKYRARGSTNANANANASIKVDAIARNEILSYLSTQNVSVQMISIAKCDNKENGGGDGICLQELQDWKLAWGSYALARNWLRECSACHSGQVLLVPVHSTFFLQSPFQLQHKHKHQDDSAIGLHLYETPFTIRNWRVEKFLRQCKIFQWDVPLLSSAIVQGDGMSVLFYLETMVGEIHEWRIRMHALESESESESDACHSNSKLHGDEMAIHNYLFYNGALRATVHDPNSGHVSLVPMGASYDNAVVDETSIVVALDGPNGAFRSWVETKYKMGMGIAAAVMEGKTKPYSSPLQSMAMEYFVGGDRIVLSRWMDKNQQ